MAMGTEGDLLHRPPRPCKTATTIRINEVRQFHKKEPTNLIAKSSPTNHHPSRAAACHHYRPNTTTTQTALHLHLIYKTTAACLPARPNRPIRTADPINT